MLRVFGLRNPSTQLGGPNFELTHSCPDMLRQLVIHSKVYFWNPNTLYVRFPKNKGDGSLGIFSV